MSKVDNLNRAVSGSVCKKTLSDITEIPIAHSSDIENGVMDVQSYKSHVEGVLNRALKCFDEMIKYLNYPDHVIKSMRNVLIIACIYHDLGKLDKVSQEIIKQGHFKIDENGAKKKLRMLNHVDAGTAFLLNQFDTMKKETYNYLLAALIIDAHHIGLLNIDLNEGKGENVGPNFASFQDVILNPDIIRDKKVLLQKYKLYKKEVINEDETVKEYVDRTLCDLINIHNKYINNREVINSEYIDVQKHPIILRLLLSCLVEGDHWDTSKHYNGPVSDIINFEIKALKRMKVHLRKYKETFCVKNKKQSRKEKQKNKVREMIHRDCEKFPLTYDFYGLYAYPGYGKTLSGMHFANRLCNRYKKRGILYMASYNNILYQNIREVEKMFLMAGERSAEIIGEHHQDAIIYERANENELNYKIAKQYSILWNCPIEFVSAVQMFETIATNHPMRIRKFNQLAGRVIIIDEFHQVVPTRLLRQTLKWLKYLTEHLGCKIIFMSGSPVEFWKIDEVKSCNIKVGKILSRKSKEAMDDIEYKRVQYRHLGIYNSFQKLARRVNRHKYPTVVVFNTLISSAIFANEYRKMYGRDKVEYISTSLSPVDRRRVFYKIQDRLKDKDDKNWVLVATSCISTGVNLSFKAGYIENCGLLSTLQLAGRINRNNEYKNRCYLNVFDLNYASCQTNNNPLFVPSMKVQNDLFQENKIDYKFCTEAIAREFKEKHFHDSGEIEEIESQLRYREVSRKYNVIPYAYKLIVTSEETKNKVENKEVVGNKELAENSVQIFFTKLDRHEYRDHIEVVNEEGIPYEKYLENKMKAPDEINIWTGEYDKDFLGYMKEVLRSLNHDVDY